MSSTTLSGPWGEIKLASATAVGQAVTAGVTAAAAFTAFPKGSNYCWLEGRNYTTAAVIQYALNPWLVVLKTTDNFAVAANTTDYSDEAQDANVTTDVVLSSLATTGALWVGSHLPFRGIFADVDAANGNAATATLTYWSTGATLATLTLAGDSTSSGGAVFAQDGAITWTVPTDWTVAAISTIVATAAAIPFAAQPLYWVKCTFSGALDSSTTLDGLYAMNRASAYDALTSGRVREFWLHRGVGGAGCIEAKTDAGTANLLATVAAYGRGSRFP